MEINDRAPKDVIKASWIVSYEERIEATWWQLVRLNSTIFVLEKIFSFPFDLFQPLPNARHFWDLVENALFETCVLIIWRVGVDDDYKEGLTLQRFKNEICKQLQTEEYCSQLKAAIKEQGFGGRVSSLKEKVREVRHNYVAHYNLQKIANPTPEQIRQREFLFFELKQYQNTLNEYFNLLCFGHRRSLLPPEYDYETTKPVDIGYTDIEQLLDNIARESTLLNLSEENPVYWSIYKKNLTEQSLKILNEYRTKFKLSSV